LARILQHMLLKINIDENEQERGNNMLRQICRVLMALGCLAGLSGPAVASPFTCPPLSLLSSLNFPNFTGVAGPYGEICVTLTDSTHATIQAETLDGFFMAGHESLALNVNSDDFTASTPTGGNGSPYTLNYFPTPPVDGLGHFDFVLDSHTSGGPTSNGSTFLTFTLTNNDGTWSLVTDVLTGNDHPVTPYDAAMKICTTAACLGFAAEALTDGHIIPQPAPEPGMLGLLGIGLLAMGWPALRRRMA